MIKFQISDNIILYVVVEMCASVLENALGF